MPNTKDEIRAVRQWRSDVLAKKPDAFISWCPPEYEGGKGCYMVSGRQDLYSRCPECYYIKGIETRTGRSIFEDKLAMIKQMGTDAFYNHKSKKACKEKDNRRIAAWMQGWDQAKAENDSKWNND